MQCAASGDALAEAGYALADHEVHVWRASIDWAAKQIGALTWILASDERQRADRFQFAADRAQYVVGRAFARILLARLTDIRPDSVQFRCNEFGKPFLA